MTRPGCSAADGVVLGRLERDYLRHDGPEHVLCFAPTRSGKGVGLVVPTLLTWPGSAIVHDIKGENWELTAGFRAGHGRVLLFDPTDAKSAAYNPLLEVRRGDWEVRDVQNIADILVDPEGSLDKRNHWEKTSHSLLVGAILHVLYAEADKTLAGVAAFLSDPSRPIEATLAAMMTHAASGRAGPHPVIAAAARELLNKSDNERSGVLSTAMSFLGLYRDPVVAEGHAPLRLADRRSRRGRAAGHALSRRAALRHRPHQAADPPDPQPDRPPADRGLERQGKRHRLLLMLDEFPALGRLDFFESALAFMAGYGIKSFLIAQSLNQIEKAYGAEQLDPRQLPCARQLRHQRRAHRQARVGRARHRDRDAAMQNYAGHRLSPWLGHLMVSRLGDRPAAAHPRRGDAASARRRDRAWSRASPPIRAKKARYYEDARFKERLLPPPDSNVGGGPPRPDDWSGLAPIEAPPMPEPIEHDAPKKPKKKKAAKKADAEDDAANADLLREPALERHIDIAPTPRPAPANEFELDEPDPDSDAARQATVRRQMQRVARQASLDPDDGIEL